MSDEPPIPENITVPLASLSAVAVEHWRLGTWLTANAGAASAGAARHALRKMGDFLARHGIAARSLDGQTFDPGMAARVIDDVADASLPPGKVLVEETLSPMVLYQGRVIRPAEIVTRTGG